MSGDGKREPEEHGALTAAEYVLGVLDAPGRRAAERRIAREPAFAREVAFWEVRLGPLAEAVPPVTPPADGWARIEAALSNAEGVRDAPKGLWWNLFFWRSLALVSTVAAVLMLVATVLLVRFPVTVPGPLLAQLESDNGQPSFYAAVNPSGTSVTVLPAALLTPEEQHALELWLIPAGEKPHSLGLIDASKPVKVIVPRDLEESVVRNAVLAVSLEPPGGSPTGQPTGPVIASGPLGWL